MPLSKELLEKRLSHDDFTAQVGDLTLHCGPDWPADALPIFPFWLRDFQTAGLEEPHSNFVVVRRGDGEALGTAGTKGRPDAAGACEIGYGLMPAAWGQGYATETVTALCEFLLAQPSVQRLTAQTAIANRASERVLEKCGFVRSGKNWDEEDGELTVWERQRGE